MLHSLLNTAAQLLLAGCLLTASTTHAQRAAGPGRPTDLLDPAFHKQRRELLRQALPARSVAVLFAAPVRNRANDVDYIYHQHPDLYYLTGYDEPEAVLVLFKEPQTVGGQAGVTEALFVQPRNPRAEQWTGRRLGAEGARQQLKVQYVADNKAFATAGIRWADFGQVHFLPLPTDVRNDPDDPADLFDLVATFRQQAAVPADFNPAVVEAHKLIQQHGATAADRLRPYLQGMPAAVTQDAYVQAYLGAKTDAERKQAVASRPVSRFDTQTLDEALNQLREVKTPEELALLRRAVRISAVGQQEVMKAVRPDMGEMEVQGLHEYVYKKYGAEFEGYPSIVGAGNNACVLHYTQNDKPRLGTDLLLMDCGAEYHGYTADVTRTIPPSGKFSPEQRQIYELVLAAQEAGIRECKTGNDFQAPGKVAQQVIADGLLKLGIIKKADDVRTYFPHGTSHYLGLDVHDRGTYGPLKAGNVITVEPGIYIPEGSPCDKKWWNIGVRIEDDILITASGHENLSAEAPRTVADIEALMAKPSALDDFRLPEVK
ncbi:aminopeptidase P N-terminal domain-containing protein [Hymenobacter weizhouensis]|uniref:aminopeptidase P N-terminal domain-containing protein n=1 Tax=Hymenobacter sp. YIM 151500-1 TaxID=2987689 RepID=UPI0022276E19|nr:aminopeptidase P N-terminal domain-containing protein [Hymenobacter sp. YIM 151500-1]UYZ62543.1 aminopeptidase P N-terminal domain-containing protein [Hymenobacter sp. YIM 151500-1]